MSSARNDDSVAELTAHLEKAIIDQLEKWVRATPSPDAPFIGSAGFGQRLSPKDILWNVRERTPLGRQLVEGWMKLAIQREITESLDGSEKHK
jgi:hypothetical protein